VTGDGAGLRLVIGPGGSDDHAVLRLWAEGSDEVEALPLQGEICLTPAAGRWCTGWRDFESGERRRCPDGRQIARGTQCDRCRIEEGF
jgi:hypothetical protein